MEKKRRTRKVKVTRKLIISAIIVCILIAICSYIYLDLKPGEPLPIAKITSKYSINNTDFFSGEPVGSGSPSTIYKGYRIGFCCYNSVRMWENTPESKRDKLVWPYVKEQL